MKVKNTLADVSYSPLVTGDFTTPARVSTPLVMGALLLIMKELSMIQVDQTRVSVSVGVYIIPKI